MPSVTGVNDGSGFGVKGENTTPPSLGNREPGVAGTSQSGVGVFGTSGDITRMEFFGSAGIGVQGACPDGTGVSGVSGTRSGLSGFSVSGPGVSAFGSPAGRFEGDVEVTGDIRLLGSQDCAEDFEIVNLKDAEPGTVMVLDQNGALEPSSQAYDKKVAGVISGAGDFRPGIILGKQTSDSPRMPIALLGKVYCKVDADYSSVDVGDLLTTSATPGHAMKADDPLKAFGAVIGKALRSIESGQGLIPVLVALQ